MYVEECVASTLIKALSLSAVSLLPLPSILFLEWSYHSLKPEFYESSDSLFYCSWGGGARMGNNRDKKVLVMNIGFF